MSNKWYGSLQNRLAEGHQFCDTIKVGTGVTEYHYSDRSPYEVVEVTDQKHISIRGLDHRAVGEPMSNNWELISNPENAVIPLVKRGENWYVKKTATLDHLNSNDIYVQLWVINNGFDPDVIRAKGQQTKYQKINISIGHAEYYYDYEF